MKVYNRAVVYFESLLFAILFVAPTVSYSQQDPVYAQYTNNLLTIQPAYAGLSGTLNCTVIARAQWIGFDGAPNTNTFTLSGPIQKYSLGLGLSIVNDRWGPIKQNGVYVDYAYRVKIVKDQYLSFGLKGGFNLYRADLTNLAIWDHPDRIFAYDIKSRFLPNMGAGILWHSDQFFLGVSIPKVIRNSLPNQDGTKIYREVYHIYGMAGKVFILDSWLKIKPTALYRWAERTPSFVDLALTFLLYDQVWIGATYRIQNSAGLIFQYHVNSQLKFGYSYDRTTFNPTQVNSGSHEFLISYDFLTLRRGQHMTPRYF